MNKNWKRSLEKALDMIIVKEGGVVWSKAFKDREEFEAKLLQAARTKLEFEYTPKHVMNGRRIYVEVTINDEPFCELWDVNVQAS